MKKYCLLMLLVINNASFAAVGNPPTLAEVAQCDPGFCFTSVKAGNELVQGIRGLDRQIRRVLEPASTGAADAVTE